MPWLVAQLSSLMRRNIETVKGSSFAASNVEQRIFMTMYLTARLVFCFISLHWQGSKIAVEEWAFQIGFT